MGETQSLLPESLWSPAPELGELKDSWSRLSQCSCQAKILMGEAEPLPLVHLQSNDGGTLLPLRTFRTNRKDQRDTQVARLVPAETQEHSGGHGGVGPGAGHGAPGKALIPAGAAEGEELGPGWAPAGEEGR